MQRKTPSSATTITDPIEVTQMLKPYSSNSAGSPTIFDPEVVKSCLPFFGGEDPKTPESSPEGSAAENPSAGGNSGQAGSGAASAAGGDSGQPEMTPQQITDLLKQVSDLTKNVNTLSKENETYKKKEADAVKATQSREEALESDLTEAQQTIAKMDSVIRHVALVNAIQSNKDLEFHSAKHVLRELDPNAFELDVDLENGTATVTGIENDLKRIAKECSWLVKSNGAGNAGNQGTPPAPRRGSGNPPSGGSGTPDAASRRADLIKRYPIIGHGRPVATR